LQATPEDWKHLEDLFQQAADLPAIARAAFLDTACAGDPALREELESLLAAGATSEDLIALTVQNEAQSLLGTEDIAGSRAGPYRIVREIGRGGMGSVYLAVRDDDQYRKEVAIKLIRHGMDTEDVLRRFRHERQILANLEHPYIARLLDGGTSAEGRPFFVMEYVTGQPLDAWCRENPLDVKQRCQLFLKICEAVSYAHHNLVVHRDLKPANIFVTPDGLPKLLDFGVAKLLDTEEGPPKSATVTNARALTLDYASPEQVRGAPVTTSTDVYSLGAILYELLAGVRAQRFTAYGAREIERVICDVDPPHLGDAAPHLRSRLQGDLDAIVFMAMRKEQDRRYQSVEEMAADLRGYLKGWPVKARQGSFAYRAGKYLRRNRTPIAVGAVLTIALAGGAAIATVQAIAARHERQLAVKSQLLAETSRKDAEAEAREARRQRVNADEQRHEAELQSELAQTQRLLAERRFDQVHQLSGKFLIDFHDAIAALPGSTPARKMVVETGLRYYDLLVRDAAGNRELLEEIARGYDRLGDVQGNPYFGNLGDVPGAETSYRKAFSIRAGVSDSSPAFQRDRIMGHVRLAEIRMAQGDFAGSERYLKDALTFAPAGPAASTYEIRDALAAVWSTLGDTKIRAGLVGEAIEPYQHLLDLSTGLARDTKDEVAAQRRLSVANTKLGDACERAQLAPEALAYLRVALAIDKRLATADPNNTSLTRKLFVTYTLLGELLREGPGRSLAPPADVTSYLQGAVNVSDKLAAAERLTVAGNEGMLVQAWQRLGGGLADAGQYDEALTDLHKADEYVEQVEKRTPGLAVNSSRRAEILYTTAQVYIGQKHWASAIEALRSAISIDETQARRDPGNQLFINEQPNLYATLADCLEAEGQRAQAVAAMQNAIARFHDIEAKRPLIPEESEKRSGHLAKLAAWQTTPN
jgi:tetratricopeptide (TPR) repeat protein/tRNA A-37 threonylcarbamoyl transferase component Bud32